MNSKQNKAASLIGIGGLCASCLTLSALGDAQSLSSKTDSICSRVPLESFVIQSHRGAGTLAPENTLESFELAWQIGTVPEADIRMTTDKVIVAFHDDNFKRLVTTSSQEMKQKKAEDLSWEEMSKLDVGAWMGKQFAGQHPPRIRDVFQAMQGHPKRWLYLDIKKVELKLLADMAREFGVSKQLIFATSDYKLIRQWKALVPESMTLLWMGDPQEKLAKKLEMLRKANFADLTQVQIHVHLDDKSTTDIFTPTSAFLQAAGKELHSHGVTFQTLPWGCYDPKIYHRLMDLGAESFATDAPKVTLEAVRTYYEAHKEAGK